MNIKLIKLLGGLVTYWVVNLVIIGLIAIVCFVVAIPLAIFVSTGKLTFSGVNVVDMAEFVFIAAFLVGTILWIKEDVFENHD